MKLVIGNKNYSSWSLRPWFLMKVLNVEFEEQWVSLNNDNLRQALGEFSPSSRVPVLFDGDFAVWDTLAICEYLNEKYLGGDGWPQDIEERTRARSIVCEMHSGFTAVRGELPMNIRAKRKVNLSQAALNDIQRIDDIWSAANEHSGWLFESFSITDAFFAPVALRFAGYNISISERAKQYQQKILNHPALQQWLIDAKAETEVMASDEAGEDV